MAVQSIFQPQLFGAGPAAAPGDDRIAVERQAVGPRSWLEHAPGWLAGADELFGALVDAVPWQQGRRRMYERVVDEPRLTGWYGRSDPLPHPLLGELFATFDRRYGRTFDSVGFNLYRNGRDSVAWHGDRVARLPDGNVVVLLSLGEARPFLLRPRGGGPSRSFLLGGGDLLVMGGQCQHELDHCVPKVARAGPRLSVTFRHGPRRPVPGRVTRAAGLPWPGPPHRDASPPAAPAGTERPRPPAPSPAPFSRSARRPPVETGRGRGPPPRS